MFSETIYAAMLVALLPIVISPVAMAVLRHALEDGEPSGMFNPRTQSWAFLFGDSLSLPISLGAATYAVREHDSRLPGDIRWVGFAAVLAIAVTVGFRTMDSAGYKKSGHGHRLNSPTKLWHDFVVYFTVSFAMVLVGIPAVMTGSIAGWLALVAFLSWLALGICDMVRGLNPEHLHPRV